MEEERISVADWWQKQRTNYVYVAMAAGILCFLAFASIWETFYGTHDKSDTPLQVLGSIFLLMLRHLAIWVPFLFLEIWAYRFIPRLEQRFNPKGSKEIRMQILIAACVAVCLLPLLVPAILVWVHG